MRQDQGGDTRRHGGRSRTLIGALCGTLLLCTHAEHRVSSAESTSSGAVAEITFDDLKFAMKKGDPFERSLLTPAIEKLHGRTVRVRGYMLPSFEQKGITQFVLVRDNMECCFGPGAALFDCVLIDMKPGATAKYSIRPVGVRGRFEISEFKGPDGKHLAIYRIVGEEVK